MLINSKIRDPPGEGEGAQKHIFLELRVTVRNKFVGGGTLLQLVTRGWAALLFFTGLPEDTNGEGLHGAL